MKRAPWLAAVLFAALVARAAAGPAETAIPWTEDLAAAKAAAAGKKPIAVLLVQKGCPLSAEFVRNLTKDERMADLAAGFAWLSVMVGGPTYKDWFAKNCSGNVEGTPSLLFLNSKGENADPDYAGLATVVSADPDDFVPALREVLQRAKQEEPAKDHAAVQAALEKAKSAGNPHDALAAFKAALRAGDGWRAEAPAMEEARAGVQKTLQEGNAEMLRILRAVHDPEEARRAFETVKTNYAGTAVADWAAEEMGRLKKAGK